MYLKKFLLVNVKDDNYVDLCQSCYDDLSNWWKSGKKESEDSKSANHEHWIDNHNGSMSCSHCHTWFYKDQRYSYMHYCPNCGTKMGEVQESEEQNDNR